MSDDDQDDELDDELAESDEPSLPQVSQSEHDLIIMARALVAGPDSNEDIWSLLCASRSTRWSPAPGR